MKTFSKVLAVAGFFALAMPVFADLCDATPNLVANCGFENGTYSSTIDGNTNNSVPLSWTPNAGFDLEPSFNRVTAVPVFQGNDALSIGNFDNQPAPALSQTLTDTSGAVYNGTLWVAYGGAGANDAGAFFQAQINNVPLVILDDTASGTFTEYSFSFAGTGSDILTLTGNTNPSEWFVDDITIPGTSAATPEPGLFLPVALLGAGLWWVRQRRGRSEEEPRQTAGI